MVVALLGAVAAALVVKPWEKADEAVEPTDWPALMDALWKAAAEGGDVPKQRGPGDDVIALLSLGDGESTSPTAVGWGDDLAEAFNEALASLRKRGAPTGDKLRLLKARVVTQLFRAEKKGAKTVTAERSLFGLGISGQPDMVFLPEEVVARTLVNKDQEVDWGNVDDLARDRGRAGDVPRGAVYQFASEGRVRIDGVDHELYRGHRRYGEVTPAMLQSALDQAARYLVTAVDGDGRFRYVYRPKSDADVTSYNILRHAGTAYAMMELYADRRDEAVRAAAERALSFLLTQAIPCLSPDETALCILEGNEIKVGGSALSVIALAEHMKVTGDRSRLEPTRRLGQRLLSIQAPSGEFTLHKQLHPDGEATDFVSEYYPGEALLALTRLYDVDPDPRWLSGAARAAKWLIQVRDGGKPVDELEHDHWLMYGLSELYRLAPDPLYLDHVRKLVDAITAKQIKSHEYEDWIGAFAIDPGSTPTSCRAEGLMAAAKLFAGTGNDPAYARKALDAARLAARMMLAAQIREETAMHLPNPKRALGGFGSTLSNYEIRIDYVQHAVSALLALRKALDEKG